MYHIKARRWLKCFIKIINTNKIGCYIYSFRLMHFVQKSFVFSSFFYMSKNGTCPYFWSTQLSLYLFCGCWYNHTFPLHIGIRYNYYIHHCVIRWNKQYEKRSNNGGNYHNGTMSKTANNDAHSLISNSFFYNSFFLNQDRLNRICPSNK